MTRNTISAWTRKLLLSAAVVALPASLPGAAPATAQSWNAEVKEVARDRPATGAPKLTPTAAGRAEAKAKARADRRKSQAAPARARRIADPAVQPPSTAAIVPISPAAGAAAAAERPAASEAFAGQPSAEEAVAATAATPTTVAVDEELDDPFADVQVVRRRTGRDMLTTQVVPVEPQGVTAAPASPASTAAENGAAAQYCTNIVDAAIDARIAWQRQNLTEAEKELQRRTGELEARITEYQRWLARRDQFAEKAKKAVVDIYTKMRPDAAAAQLQSLDEETAAAVLIKLDTRAASAVMNEMEATQAARLTAIISGAGKLPPRPRAPTGQGNRS